MAVDGEEDRGEPEDDEDFMPQQPVEGQGVEFELVVAYSFLQLASVACASRTACSAAPTGRVFTRMSAIKTQLMANLTGPALPDKYLCLGPVHHFCEKQSNGHLKDVPQVAGQNQDVTGQQCSAPEPLPNAHP